MPFLNFDMRHGNPPSRAPIIIMIINTKYKCVNVGTKGAGGSGHADTIWDFCPGLISFNQYSV